ncbi:MAG: PKD domain-containing protein, partial [gamma proteobacterium endosymbiont of Lamellibrachia anaximandri]|nr:PKD domain-containing protein [gamma proteobacterium endosymbiont of Lamellibrachia anaximandri]
MAISIKKVLIAILLAGSFFAPWNFAQQLQIRSAIVIPGQVVSIPVEITPDVLGVHGYQFDLDVVPSAGAPVPTIESVNSGSVVNISADLQTQPGTPTVAPIQIGLFVAFPPTDPIQSFDGPGSIADINFTIPLNAIIGQNYQLELSDLTLVGAGGESIPVTVWGGTLTVGSTTAFPDTLSPPGPVTVGEGQSEAVIATVTGGGHPIPGVSLQYSIDDPSIASLSASLVQTGSDGAGSVNVTGLMDGTTTIRISAFSLGEVTVQLTVLGISPIITSTPPLEVIDGENYLYDVDAWDPNSDPISYQLTVSPVGMMIDLNSGIIEWLPPADQPQAGNEVTVEARDPSGNKGIQSFSIFIVRDLDNDGFESRLDCNDNDPLINPDALEIPYDGIDNDCDPATRDDDVDGDGYLVAADCDDTNAAINPGATEVHYNLLDDDCDSMTLDYVDNDADGYFTQQNADYPQSADCDDDNPRVHPGATEIILNGIDDDCDAATPDSQAKTFVVMIDQGGKIYYAKSHGDGNFGDYKLLEDIGAYNSRGIAIADFNNDGHLDFVAGGGKTAEVDFYLFENDGSDNFLNRGIVVGHDVSGSWVYDMSAGDLNNDGNTDFVSNTNSKDTVVALGDGNGGFTSTLLDLGVTGGGVDLADLNSDGKIDLIRSQLSNGQIEVFISRGDGSFDPPQIVGDAGGNTHGVVAADFDNDGVVDIFANNSGTGDATFFKGFGDGTFINMGIEASLDPNNYSAYDGYDYNNDGNVDVVLTDHTGRSLWYYPGNGDSTFDSRVEINPASTTTDYVLGVSAPPYRADGMPYAIIRPNSVHLPLGGTVDFDGSDSNDNDDGGVITSYEWNFGDGGTATGSTATYTYGVMEENYLARLTVTDDEGKIAHGFAQVYIEGSPPVANSGGPYTFGEEVAANGIYTVTLDGGGSIDDQGIETYAWDFDDSDGIQVESTNIAPVHAYDAVGIYNATLTVTDHAKQQDTVTTTVTITNSTQPDAQHGGPYTIDENDAVGGTWTLNLDASASSDDVGIEKYEWDMDATDGFQVDATGVTPEVTYTVPGDYTVTLRVYDHALQMAEVTTTVAVLTGDAPDASHGGSYAQTEDNAVGGDWTVTLDASASTDDSGIFLYEWDFDASDGIQVDATGEAVDVTYTSVGDYTVTVRVYDNALQMTEVTTTVSVTASGVPVANAGGPYEVDESDASHGIWTVNLDGTGSTDDIALFDYEWRFSPLLVDDFADTTLDTSKWIFSADGVTQDERVSLLGDGSNWGSRWIYSQETFPRESGLAFQARVKVTENDVGAGFWGFKNANDTYKYDEMPYAFYFHTTGVILIYEDGQNRGSMGSYVRGMDYDIRITLKLQGARYEIKEAGAGHWTLLYDSSYAREEPLRVGGDVRRGTFEIDDVAVQVVLDGAVVSRRYSSVGNDGVTLRVRDNALQESFDTTTITVVDGGAPTAGPGGPYTAEVGSLITFDGTGSTDETVIQQYDWTFGDTTGGPDDIGSRTANLPYTGKGARPQHFYRQTGTYDLTLTVTDNVGNNAAAATTVEVVVGDPPTADAGDPYHAAVNGPPAYFDATGSTDDYGIVEYRWDFDSLVDSDGDGDAGNDIDAVGPRPFHIYSMVTGQILDETFDGSVIDESAWIHSGVTQNDRISITGDGSWSTRYLFSKLNAGRHGASYTGQVRPVNASGGQQAMWGLKDTSTNHSHTKMPHAIYFTGGEIYIFEMGSNRGLKAAYTPGTLYDVRIDLKSSGATYYIKEATATDWIQLYDSDNRSDSPLKIGVTVRLGSFEFDDFEGRGPDAHTATLTVEDGAGQTATDTTTVTVARNLPPDVITVPWVAHDPIAPHETYNGKQIHLKGIVRDADPVRYQWDYGDGVSSVVTDITDPYDLSVTHTYPDAPEGTPFVATLRVWDSQDQVGEETYNVVVKKRNLTTEINVAIDEGLWYLHRSQERATSDGFPAGSWSSNGIYPTSTSASTLQAFEINGHLEQGDHQENPYAESVDRGLKYLFSLLKTYGIATQTYGEPDTNSNGLGVSPSAHEVYASGMVMDAIASSRSPLARTLTGGADIVRRRYFDLLTDMADQYAWGQQDNGKGGWRYTWNGGHDNSVSQWGAIGLQAAQEIFGIPIPLWVKEQNEPWLDSTYNGKGFGYSSTVCSRGCRATTPSGMIQLAFDGFDTGDYRWFTSEDYFASIWSEAELNSVVYTQTCDVPGFGIETCRDYYAMYAFTKAMRLGNPEPVINLAANGYNWFEDPDDGIARLLVNDQVDTGRFQGDYLVSRELRSAWAVIMLSRTLFVQPPVADAGRDRVWAVDLPLEFDGSASYHLDLFRSLVKYEWDFDGDGVFDASSTEPTATHTYTSIDYPEPTLPQLFTVTLRVTDNNIPALTATDTVEVIVAIPPHPPVADANGPYTCTAGLPCALDGIGSFDIDPTDFIARYEWELDVVFPYDFAEASGATPSYVWATLGTYNIGLRVWDNGILNDLDGDGELDEDERLSDQDFTTVTVIENLAPVADANGPYTVDEGSTVALDGTGSSDPNGDSLTYSWDYNNDGAYDDASGLAPAYAGLDDGIYPVELQVTDGLLSSTSGTSVTVNNAAPVVEAGPDQSGVLGDTIALAPATFTDAGVEDTHTVTIDWGDGTTDAGTVTQGAGSGSVAGSHAYAADGN